MEGDEMGNNGQASLADLIFDLCVNFLMYALLILVMYMMVRFYLEEDFEFDESQRQYDLIKVSEAFADASDGASSEHDSKGELLGHEGEGDFLPNINDQNSSSLSDGKPKLKKKSSFLNLNEWGEPEGTKEEVIQRAIFCAAGLNICFVF